MPNARPQLSFVLPLTFREEPGDLVWRSVNDRFTLLRFRLLLASFFKFFDLADLRQFLIVSPAPQVEITQKILAEITADPRFVVQAETKICPALSDLKKQIPGWYIQQLLKLAAADWFDTPYYLTLDNDIFWINSCSAHDFFQQGKALLNLESSADYQNIYQPHFVQEEIQIKRRRYLESQRLLNYPQRQGDFGGLSAENRFFGETPVLLNLEAVKALTQFLENSSQMPWPRALLLNPPWTEYGLYFLFLEKQQKLAEYYTPTHCCQILDLALSVWQKSKHYLNPRPYSPRYFFQNPAAQGYFAAIQSWLEPEDWLPPNYPQISAFYLELLDKLNTLP